MREGGDGTTTRSASSDDGATAGAESGSLLELRRGPLGGVPQPAAADVPGRGGPVHAGHSALPNPVLHAVSAGVPTGGRRRAGAAARRVRARRDRAGGAASLPRAPERAGDPSGVG